MNKTRRHTLQEENKTSAYFLNVNMKGEPNSTNNKANQKIIPSDNADLNVPNSPTLRRSSSFEKDKTTNGSPPNSCPNFRLLSLKHKPHRPFAIRIKKEFTPLDDIPAEHVANNSNSKTLSSNVGTKDSVATRANTIPQRGILRRRSSVDIRRVRSMDLESTSPNRKLSSYRSSIDIGSLQGMNPPKSKEIIKLDPTKPNRLNQLINSEIISFNARPPSKLEPQYSDSWIATREFEDVNRVRDVDNDVLNLPDLNNNPIKDVILRKNKSCQKDLRNRGILKRHSIQICSHAEYKNSDSSPVFLNIDKNKKKEAITKSGNGSQSISQTEQCILHTPVATPDYDKLMLSPDEVTRLSPETQQLLLRKQMINNMTDYRKPKQASSVEFISPLNRDKSAKWENLRNISDQCIRSNSPLGKKPLTNTLSLDKLNDTLRSHSAQNLRCETTEIVKKSKSFNDTKELNTMVKHVTFV